MPFTLAHPAAILPLRGSRFLPTAPLIIGAMTPDLPYFLPGAVGKFIPETHEFESSFTIDLLLGYFALVAIFVLRKPLTALLSARSRWLCLKDLAPFSRSWTEWVFAAGAIVIGVWTHLLWDSFTHTDGWIVHRVSALSASVTFGSYTEPVCHVLQYISSVFGLIVMTVWYWRLPAPARVAPGAGAPRSAVRPILMLIATAALLIGGVQAIENYHHAHAIYRTVNILLTHSLTWFAALYLVAGVVVTLERQSDWPDGKA